MAALRLRAYAGQTPIILKVLENLDATSGGCTSLSMASLLRPIGWRLDKQDCLVFRTTYLSRVSALALGAEMQVELRIVGGGWGEVGAPNKVCLIERMIDANAIHGAIPRPMQRSCYF